MKKILARTKQLLRWLATPVRLVRQGESDLDGTYPDRARPTGEQAALQGSVSTSLISGGGMAGF